VSALYTSRVRVEKVEGVHRRAILPVGDPIEMGVHGPVAQLFKIEAIPLPLPVDYIVGATAG
jgi:hypothetical protein